MTLYMIDACISHHIASALRIAGYDAKAVREVLNQSAPDHEIFQWCAVNDAVLLTKDYQMRRKRLHAAMLKKYGISVVFFREGKKHWRIWQWFYQVFRQIGYLEHEFSTSHSPTYLVCRSIGNPEAITF